MSREATLPLARMRPVRCSGTNYKLHILTKSQSWNQNRAVVSSTIPRKVSTLRRTSLTNAEIYLRTIVLSHIISQLRPGADLSRVVLPTFILEPRSMLERITK